MDCPRIAYTMSRFPHLPETFILREMAAVEAQGYHVSLYPLLLQEQRVVHEEARRWLPRARTFSWRSSALWQSGLKTLRQAPAGTLTLFWEMVRGLRASPGFLSRGLFIFPRAIAAGEALRADKITHLHVHYATHPALFAWLIHRLTGLSYSVTVHAHDIFVNRTMLGPKLHEAAFVVAISQYNRDFLLRRLGAPLASKIHVVHCGILPDRYQMAPAVAAGSFETLDIITIGSLQPYKGLPVLIEALTQLRERAIPFRCRIVGEGAQRPRLEKMVAQRRLVNQVQLLGARTESEVAALLPTANCYVQPSVRTASGKMEGIPVALMEALASGLPVVASALSGIPELVQDGRTGYLTPPGDATALAQRLTRLYQRPEEAAALAAAGRRLVRHDFNLRDSARRLAALFATVRDAPLAAGPAR